MTLNEVLSECDELVKEYKAGAYLTTESLRKVLRELSANHYLITKENVDSYEDWNNYVYILTKNKENSVSGAKIKADKRNPELRMTRKILETLEHVIWSIKSEISTLNKDVKPFQNYD